MTDRIKLLKKLRESIPEFKCIPGCTQCCGNTPWSRFEWELLPEKDKARFDRFSFICSFCDKEVGCTVHEHRTIICRAFGTAEGMPCPRGVKADNMLDKAAIVAIFKTYQKHFFNKEQIS